MNRPQRIIPLKLGLNTGPPSLVLIYKVGNGGSKERSRKRKIPLRNFNDKSDVSQYAHLIRQRHEEYFRQVPGVTLHKMLRIIQEIDKGLQVDEAVQGVDKEFQQPPINPNEDLNKISIQELERKKELMNSSYLANAVNPEDPNFVYDRRIEFEPKGVVSDPDHNKDPNDWDDEEEVSKKEVKETEGAETDEEEEVAAKDLSDPESSKKNEVKLPELMENVQIEKKLEDKKEKDEDDIDIFDLGDGILEFEFELSKSKESSPDKEKEEEDKRKEDSLADDVYESKTKIIKDDAPLTFEDDDDFWS